MDYKCDKRNAVHFQNKGKYFRLMGDLYVHQSNELSAPLFINDPNIVALMLNVSDTNFFEASKIYNEYLLPYAEYDEKNKVFTFNIKDSEKLVFDLIEKLFTSIVFAYTSVEAFSNNLIPNDFELVRIKKKNKIIYKIVVDKEYIMRFETINEKVKFIIPKIYKFNFDREDLFNNFENLKLLRDRIVHPKTEKNNAHPSQIGFFSDIFYSGINDEIVNSARELIKYLSDEVNSSTVDIVKSPHIPYEFVKERKPTFEEYLKF